MMRRPMEHPRWEGRAFLREFDWILEAFAPLRFPLAQGLWLLGPWLGSERVARWVADLEGRPQAEREDSP